MADIGHSLTVVDVYDQAATIGKEFEKIIDSYGADSVSDLLPRVIKALEQLEKLATYHEKENAELHDLREEIHRLHLERADRLAERNRFEQEVEAIEDGWKKDSKELQVKVTRLQEENRRLKSEVDDHRDKQYESAASSERELAVISKMKETVDHQRNEISSLQDELFNKTTTLESYTEQADKLSKKNEDLRNQLDQSSQATEALTTDKARLEAVVQEQEQQLSNLTQQLQADAAQTPVATPTSATSSTVTTPDNPIGESLIGYLLMDSTSSELSGKLVVDQDDPNRPRFSMAELKQILVDRKELRSKLRQTEEELLRYKHQADTVDTAESAAENSGPEDSERPVQGPINREPDDKMFPGRRQSGIRALFRNIF